MQVVVLAGGQGTRLRPLTYDTPKALLPIMGRAMLAQLLARLPVDCDEILLTVSHRADDLRDWVRRTDDAALDGREVIVIEETEPLGTAGAVANCAARLEGSALVLNGDLLSDVSFHDLRARHAATGALGTIALHRVDDPTRYGVVDQDQGGKIRSFVEKPARSEAPSDLVNAGAYLLEPEAIDMIPRGRPVSIEREVFPALCQAGRGLYGYRFSGLWIDCGTPESYIEVHRALAARMNGPPNGAGWRAARAATAPGVHLEDAVLFDGVRIGQDAAIVRTVVGRGAVIGARSRLEDCVVGPGEVVEDDTHARHRRFGLRGWPDDPPAQ